MDASALIKLLLNEAESDALTNWLDARTDTLRLTSAVARVEVIRVCRRTNEAVVPAARLLLASLILIPPDADILEHAGLVGPPLLRSLDAIHLASALSIRDELSAFVAYDQRLLAAADQEHLPTIAPS